jgi:glycosyltransferase involved in cell wall biosynthesis
MRIAFVTPEYITEQYFSGGLANYLHRVSKALVSLGHEVHIIVLSEIDGAEFEQDGNGSFIRRINITDDPFKRWFNRLTRYQLLETVLCLTFSFRAYQKLMQLHGRNPFDIVQFPDWNASGLVSSWLLPIPWVTRISSYRRVWYEKGGYLRSRDQRLIEWLEWAQMRLSKFIFAPSHTLKQLLAKEAGITNVQVIRSPSYLEVMTDWDHSVFAEFLEGKEYLLFFGRFEKTKGFHILAQALPSVLEKYPDCHAAFVGMDADSDLAPSMKEYARSLCQPYLDRISFFDQLPHTQLYPVIAGAKLVVLPSLIDNLPNACLESMAIGKPILGTIGASFEEMLTDGETGFLVPTNDVDALSTKIQQVWMRTDLHEIGEAAKSKMQEFSIEQTVNALLNYYRGAVGNATGSKHPEVAQDILL